MIPDFTDTALSRLWSLDGRVAVVTGGGSGRSEERRVGKECVP